LLGKRLVCAAQQRPERIGDLRGERAARILHSLHDTRRDGVSEDRAHLALSNARGIEI
jgi:hypothetical protein